MFEFKAITFNNEWVTGDRQALIPRVPYLLAFLYNPPTNNFFKNKIYYD